MFNAANARKMTNESLIPTSNVVDPYMKHIAIRIIQAAKLGKHSIIHPFRQTYLGTLNYPTQEIRESIRKSLEANGYTWKDHPNLDPGHPGSGPYIEISW